MFDFARSPRRDPPLLTWARWIVGLCTAVFLLDGAVASYRAWVQVYSVSVHTTHAALGPGASVQVRVVTSGRTFVEVRLEVLQSGQAELLATRQIPKNGDAAMDPRPQRHALTVALPPALWNRLHSGPAVLRATATGRPQWLRTPPPTVREIAVALK